MNVTRRSFLEIVSVSVAALTCGAALTEGAPLFVATILAGPNSSGRHIWIPNVDFAYRLEFHKHGDTAMASIPNGTVTADYKVVDGKVEFSWVKIEQVTPDGKERKWSVDLTSGDEDQFL